MTLGLVRSSWSAGTIFDTANAKFSQAVPEVKAHLIRNLAGKLLAEGGNIKLFGDMILLNCNRRPERRIVSQCVV